MHKVLSGPPSQSSSRIDTYLNKELTSLSRIPSYDHPLPRFPVSPPSTSFPPRPRPKSPKPPKLLNRRQQNSRPVQKNAGWPIIPAEAWSDLEKSGDSSAWKSPFDPQFFRSTDFRVETEEHNMYAACSPRPRLCLWNRLHPLSHLATPRAPKRLEDMHAEDDFDIELSEENKRDKKG